MSYTAISVQGVGKSFPRDDQRRKRAHQAISEVLRAPFVKPAESADPYAEGFWALRDVSFEVTQGEIIGVVGHNGAGKSVLLKLLSRVTQPTHGRMELRGQVAPLLEVGTGFHPDLTGRENIYLNGVILGMRRADVHRRVDEIVAFSGVADFLDMPIKRYSSGMRMRLAFAVAAHLDRDIFLLDEVLTVGDREFQDKCLARLKELAREGRTILLVSHGDYHIETFCTRAMLFDHGRLVADGAPAEVNLQYYALRAAAVAADGGVI
jgi:lipopolysaccharide transport system ATP-binding protein